MRVLFTSLPATGHFNSILPTATALAQAGHEVAICCARPLRAEVVASGFEHLAGGADSLDELREGGPDPYDWPARSQFTQLEIFATRAPQRLIPDLFEHVRAWEPDLLVRESSEFGACLVAEKLGLPHASIGTGAWSSRDERRAFFADRLSTRRAELELPPDPDAGMMFRYLQLAFTPARWDGEVEHPRTVHFIRHENLPRPGDARPAWLDRPRTDPLVLASMGTIMHDLPGLFEAIIDALANEPISVVAAVGRDQDLARFGTPPPNVRILPFVPQLIVLPECTLFVTHGGFNSTKEALSLGIPLVVIPIGGDQWYSAERVEALGLGRAIGPEERTPETIRTRVREVLAEARYPASARRFAAEMRALPPVQHAVGLLERLARDPRPILRPAE